ncbi:MAG TPA: universal stress protein [Syntrophorhabdaceae bacterium]|jgi:nucleotide-binding universal stress UspA family protein
MFKHILLPLDGSSLAECAIPYAAALAKAFDARITLLRVLEKPYQNGCSQPVDPLDWRMCKVEAKSYLDNLAGLLGERGPKTESVLLDGDPAQHIVKLVGEWDLDLIALSSHGQSGLSSWNYGSVMRKVIALAHSSILVVRAYKETQREEKQSIFKRIVLPLDGSKRAECVLSPAIALAQAYESKLFLVHVTARPEMPRLKVPTQEDMDLADRVVERNLEEMTRQFEQLEKRANVDTEIRVVADSHVAERLHELVKQEKADLVILSAHGYSGKTKWPYGSVASTFIEYGVTPLLVVQDLPRGAVEPSEAETVARQMKGH